MNNKELKNKIYGSIDYTDNNSLYRSKLEFERILESSIKISEEEKSIYLEAISDIDDSIKYGFRISSNSISYKNIPDFENSFLENVIYKNNGVFITVNPDIKRNWSSENAYFKIYNSENYRKATKVARITLIVPKYIIHSNDDGKGNWDLSSSERKLLDNIMHSKKNGISNWESLCTMFNNMIGRDLNFPKEIPDFKNIKKEKK